MAKINYDTLLAPEILETIRERLGNEYTDQQIAKAAYLLGTSPMLAGAFLGFADDHPRALVVTTNLFAAATFLELAVLGLLDIEKLAAYSDTLIEAEEKKRAEQSGES